MAVVRRKIAPQQPQDHRQNFASVRAGRPCRGCRPCARDRILQTLQQALSRAWRMLKGRTFADRSCGCIRAIVSATDEGSRDCRLCPG